MASNREPLIVSGCVLVYNLNLNDIEEILQCNIKQSQYVTYEKKTTYSIYKKKNMKLIKNQALQLKCVQIKEMCIVISKRCICQYSGIHVYKPVKFIILDVKTSLLSLRPPCMPTQLILSYFHGFVIFIKFYRFITLFNAMLTNASL